MAATTLDGPQIVYGPLAAIPASFGANGVVDPNQDAGPNGFYLGQAMLDLRLVFLKDNIIGVRGAAQSHLLSPFMKSISQIPATLANNNIAAAANVVANTPMTLASATLGITLNVPIHPYSQVLNAATVTTAAIALDFGFGFGNVTSGSTTIPVSSSTLYFVGMPLVIGGVGNSGGTIPLLTSVASIVDATNITVVDSPLASNSTAPIGMGDLWGPVPAGTGTPTPTAAYPFFAHGPQRMLDPRQAVTRGVRIVGSGGGSGGNFTVAGWDIYGQPMTETITVAAGASTGWSKKCFKYIGSVTPLFTDANNYSVGTSDVFGFAYRSNIWEETTVFWAGAMQTSSQGWLTADQTDPATATTGDVRGTIQTSASGGGTGIGASASNGTVSSLAMTGRRLEIGQQITVADTLLAGRLNTAPIFGVTQV